MKAFLRHIQGITAMKPQMNLIFEQHSPLAGLIDQFSVNRYSGIFHFPVCCVFEREFSRLFDDIITVCQDSGLVIPQQVGIHIEINTVKQRHFGFGLSDLLRKT